MLTTDDDLRDALAPLRAVQPTDADVVRVLDASTAVAAPRPARRPAGGWRPALTLGAAAAIAVGVVALPGETPDDPSVGALLGAAAATAAERPPAPVTQGRWTAVRETLTYRDRAADGRTAQTTFTQPVERWIGHDGRGLERRGSVVGLRRTGDRRLLRLQPTSSGPTGDRPYVAGDAIARAAELPSNARAARAALDRGLAARYGGRALPAEQVRWERTRAVVDLLGTGALRPEQRSALWGVLAATDGVQSPGVQRDTLGRRGPAITIDFAGGLVPARNGVRVPLPEGTLRVVFDPGTAELLETSFLHDGSDGNAGTPDRVDVYERAGWSDDAGRRPASR